jgi:hypothetical protein
MNKCLFVVAFLGCINFVQAQESINASGGVSIGTGGAVSFSVGQMVYTTDSKESGSMVQGIQRPYRITTTDITFYRNEIDYSGKREGISRTNIYTNHAGLIPSLCYPIGYFYK